MAKKDPRCGVCSVPMLGMLVLALLAIAFFWPKLNSRWDDFSTANLAGKTYYENMDCTCIGIAVPQDDCKSCTRNVDCYGVPVSCQSSCFRKINDSWQSVICGSNGSAGSQDYPKDKESCEARGGSWGPIGLSPAEVCVMPTKDAGKECRDSSECESSCIATLSQSDYERIVRDRLPVYTTGNCAADNAGVGCNAYVKNGVVSEILCVD